MGAYGAALIGIERFDGKTPSGIVSREGLDHFSMTNMHTRCGLCENNCQLTISRFNDGSRFITGNRCERGAGHSRSAGDELNNLSYL